MASAFGRFEKIGDRACNLLHGHVVVRSLAHGFRSALPACVSVSEIAARLFVKTWARSGDLGMLLQVDYQGLADSIAETIAEVTQDEAIVEVHA